MQNNQKTLKNKLESIATSLANEAAAEINAIKNKVELNHNIKPKWLGKANPISAIITETIDLTTNDYLAVINILKNSQAAEAKAKIHSLAEVVDAITELKSAIEAFSLDSDQENVSLENLIKKTEKNIKEIFEKERKMSLSIVAQAKKTIEHALTEKLQEFEKTELHNKLITSAESISLPTKREINGSIHPISFVGNEIINIFKKYGFEVNYGPEIEDDWHNFTALNMPKNHPARQMHDTFYIQEGSPTEESMESKKYLLRTHTTSVDIRAMMSKKPPVRSLSFGRTYRCDSDKTHSPMFHQIEMLYLDENINFGHLKFLINSFLRDFFNTDDIEIRLRSSFFPFTEPSAEVDIRYDMTENGIVPSKNGSKYLEILGCGMLHPNVLKECGIDSNKYQAAAFGMGVERMAMLKYGMKDLREFFVGDLNWIGQNNFNINLW